MKKYFIVSIVMLLLLSFSVDANAQRRRHKKRKRPAKTEETDKIAFKDRLWYGGSLGLNFSGGSTYSTFFFGLSPMVGYKFTDKFSVGPRISVNYVYLKATGFGGDIFKENLWSYSAGLFSRFKIIESIFAHVEYEYENLEVFTTSGGRVIVGANGKIQTLRESRDNLYLGAGYSRGDIFRYEFYVLYNVMEDNSTLQLPFNYRIGFTYNF